MPRLIDLTRPLSSTTPPWPGDVGVSLIHHARISDGYSCNVGQLTLSLHNGTHADAPFHYSDHGATIDQIPLETYLGPVWVIEASGRPALTTALFANLDFTRAPRVLQCTLAHWADPLRVARTPKPREEEGGERRREEKGGGLEEEGGVEKRSARGSESEREEDGGRGAASWGPRMGG